MGAMQTPERTPNLPREHGRIQRTLAFASSLPEVFSKLGLSRSCNQASQRSWNELSSGPSYLWDSPATEPSPSWPASSGSPTRTATVSPGPARPACSGSITAAATPGVPLTEVEGTSSVKAWARSSCPLLRLHFCQSDHQFSSEPRWSRSYRRKAETLRLDL